MKMMFQKKKNFCAIIFSPHGVILLLETQDKSMGFLMINILVSVVTPCINKLQFNLAAAGWLYIILFLEEKILLIPRIFSARKAPDPEIDFSAWDKEKIGRVLCTSWHKC